MAIPPYCMNRFVDVTLPPYPWTRCRKRHNDDLKPHRNLKNPVSVHLYGVLLFLSPHANELRTGIREKNHRGGSLNLCAWRVANPKRGSRRTVAKPAHYGRVSQAGRIGRKEEARHGRMNRQSLQAGAVIGHPARHTIRLYTDAVWRQSASDSTSPLGGLRKAPPALPDKVCLC